jgi:hypothetical protein
VNIFRLLFSDFDAPARITANGSKIWLEIKKEFLGRPTIHDPEAAELLETFQAKNGVYPDTLVQYDQLRPLLRLLAALKPGQRFRPLGD